MGDVNKLFVSKSLLTTPNNVLPLHFKQTFPTMIWIFNEGKGDGIKSRLPFKIFSTLNNSEFEIGENIWWIRYRSGDLGKLDEDQFLWMCGRLKELIITAGGENIAPLPIENNILAELSDILSYVIGEISNE